MLGEDHALLIDFPEYKSTILALNKSDEDFAAKSKRYHALDKEIRELELANDPIADAAMQDLKHERRELKDMLYYQMTKQGQRD